MSNSNLFRFAGWSAILGIVFSFAMFAFAGAPGFVSAVLTAIGQASLAEILDLVFSAAWIVWAVEIWRWFLASAKTVPATALRNGLC